MKALIFAAGLGTRLKPFTESHPKALVPVAGKPMLGRVIEKIRDAGITDIIVNVHHFASQITDYLEANRNFGINIHVSDESGLLLETGGAVARCARLFDLTEEPLLVHNSDILTDFSLKSMCGRFNELKPDALLLVKDRDTSRKLLFDKDDRLCGWRNLKTGELKLPLSRSLDNLEQRAFGGVHLISPALVGSLLDYNDALVHKDGYLCDNTGATPFSITDFYIAGCPRLDILGYDPGVSEDYSWFDVGRPETLEEAECFIDNKS